MKKYVPLFESFEDAWYTYARIQHEEMMDMIRDKEKGVDKQPWDILPFARVKKIWNDRMTAGVVRDEKTVDNMADLVVRNIAKLEINTIMSGHTPEKPSSFIENETGYHFKGDEPDMDDSSELSYTYDEFNEWTDKYIYDEIWRQWRISDYAMKPLLIKAAELLRAETAEDKVGIMDQIFNIVHPRGDIASLFIEGGSNSLAELSS